MNLNEFERKIQKNLKYGLKQMNDFYKSYAFTQELLSNFDNLSNSNIVKQYLDYHKKHHTPTEELVDYQALSLKYRASTAKPSIIEKTMSPAQLYISENPLWTIKFTAKDVKQILINLEEIPFTKEAFNDVVNCYKNNKRLLLDEFGNIPRTGGIHGKSFRKK
jgi:hypothetical protein